MIKRCSKCKIEKETTEFYKRRDRAECSVRSMCKSCCKPVFDNLPRKKDSELVGESKNRRKKVHRKSNLKRKFGMSIEDYDKMLNAQGGCCAICNSTEAKGKHNANFMIDHCHTTEKIRGLLCNDCNLTLGKIGDNVEVLEKMIAYLRKHIA